MTLSKIKKKVGAGDYDVKLEWPRGEQVLGISRTKKTLAALKEMRKLYRKEQKKTTEVFCSDIKNACVEEGATKSAAELIFIKAWEDGHSDGLEYIIELADELMDIVKAMK